MKANSQKQRCLALRYDYSASPSIYDVMRDGKYAFGFLIFLHLAASEPLG